MYIKIIKAQLPTYWYADRIDHIFKVDKNISWENDYTVKYPVKHPYYNVYKEDCVIYKPTLLERFLTWLNY